MNRQTHAIDRRPVLPDVDQPVVYRMAPELRRSAWIVIAGIVPCMGALLYVHWLVQPRTVADLVVGFGLLLGLQVAMIVPLRWAIRVDEHGIWSRLVAGWDLWPWSDFAAGMIRKRHPMTLVDPRRPWWRRSVRLHAMNKADLTQVLARVNSVYRLPPAPTVPETLQIQSGYRRYITFDIRGIEVMARGVRRAYGWQEVERLRVVRVDPLRRDFHLLQLFLPHDEIQLHHVTHQGGSAPNWRGADVETMNEFLLARVPTSRIDIELLGERPSRRCDVERVLAGMRDKQRQLRRWMPVLIVLLAALPLVAVHKDIWTVLALIALVIPFYVVFIWSARLQQRRLQRCEAWLAEFAVDEPSI